MSAIEEKLLTDLIHNLGSDHPASVALKASIDGETTHNPLQRMLNAQYDLQKIMPPLPNRAESEDPTVICEYIKDNVLAALDELHELLNETGWKPWATSRHVNYQSARSEWIDAWHFMMNLATRLGMSATMIEEQYFIKHAKNRARQAAPAGYDGVTGKCPVCHRDYEDPGVGCTPGVCKVGA